MVHADDVISIYRCLAVNNIQAWLTGGWGIDALLCEQTRSHKDLDVIVLLDDVVRLRALMSQAGYELKEIWSENCPAVDAQGNETPTAFVLRDAEGREIDVHALRFDDCGNGIPAWVNDEGLVFTKKDLAGEGMIAGVAIRCLSPVMQRVCHTGYHLPNVQLRDLDLLRAKFDLEYPDDLLRLRQANNERDETHHSRHRSG